MGAKKRDVYLVGTIPFWRLHQVFKEVGERLGTRVRRCPDGEIGDRQYWVLSQYHRIAASPAVEAIAYRDGVVARSTGFEVPLRLRKGADTGQLASLDLNYANYAVGAYKVFKSMKDAGKIPQSWRFQVNIPSPMDLLSLLVPEDRAAAEAPLERAILDDVARLQDAIPHNELAISWDIVRSVLIFENPGNSYFAPWFNPAETGILDRVERLCRAVAPDAEVGLHLCYGDQDHSHAVQPRDLSACVKLSNLVSERSNRRIDYIHVPVPRDRTDDQYFSPLRDLNLKRIGHLYIGLIHYTDGIEGSRNRMAVAERFCDDFGIATECGFGRRPSHQDLMKLLDMHAELAG
jgi:hypothetical protein